jgi:hypothetical protein
MRLGWKTASQLLALLLAFALMQVYVMATPAAMLSESAESAGERAEVFGRLSSVGYGKVIVNGNEVFSGTTILSGAQIQTPDTTAAIVSLGSAGKLDIAPKTSLTLTFDRSSVVVNVVSGDALLTTNAGVKGLLTAPDGQTKTADGQSVFSVGTALYQQDNKNPPGQDDDDNDNERKCRMAGMPCALFWVMVGGGAAVVTGFAMTRGNNSSPSNPTS